MKLMHTIMLIQNIEHSYIVAASKYTNFVTLFFFSSEEECFPAKVNTNLQSTWIILLKTKYFARITGTAEWSSNTARVK